MQHRQHVRHTDHHRTKLFRRAGLAAFISVLLLAAASAVWAQESQPPTQTPIERHFQNYNLGVAEMRGAILQDADGFMWFSSLTGLIQWDGVSVKKYDMASGLASSYTISVYEDRTGTLWIMSSGGFNKYDKATNTFTVYRNDPNDPTSLSLDAPSSWFLTQGIVQDSDGFIWIATAEGLNKLDHAQERFTRYAHDPSKPGSLISGVISALLVGRDGALWVGTQGGLCRLNKGTETFTCYAHDANNPASLSHDAVTALFEDHAGMLWVGTADGLNRFDADKESFTVYKNNPDDPTSLFSNTINDIAEDDEGYLWLTHHPVVGGMSVFDPRTSSAVRYLPGTEAGSLPSADPIGVYKDRQGMMWVINYEGVASRYDPAGQPFTTLETTGFAGAIEVSQDRVLVVTMGPDNLQTFDRKTQKFTSYSFGGKSFCGLGRSSDGTYWIADSQGTLYTLDLETMTLPQSYKITTSFIPNIEPDRHTPNILWLTTDKDGLVKFNVQTEEITYYKNIPGDPTSLSANVIWAPPIQEENNPDLMWVGTYGINLFNKKTGKVEKLFLSDEKDPDSLSSSILHFLYKSAAGEYWGGTANGLNKFDPETGTVIQYTKANGLFPVNVFAAMAEDKQGNLWMSSYDRGELIRFNPATETYKLYGKGQGVDVSSYQIKGVFKSHSDELWFGGSDKGVVVFDPARVKDNTYKPPVYITSLTQGGDPIKLPAAPERIKTITIPWEKPFFEFEMAALNYTSPQENRYKYILEGWDKDWFESRNLKIGRYSGLTGGTYTLKVMGSNNDGLWSDKIAELQVIVTTPFWATWWFRGGLATLLIGSVVVGLVMRVRVAEARRRELEVKVQERTKELAESNQQLTIAKEKAEIASRAKSDFLSSMSHELRTPLNGIMGYAQILGQDQSMTPVQKDGLEIIYQSGSHLLTLINDILDLAKVEAGKLDLIPSDFHFPTFLSGVAGIIKMRAEQRNIGFVYDAPDDLPVGVHADEKRLRQVLLNLLGNAVKFTKEGSVTLRVSSIGNAQLAIGNCQLRFEIIDTGVGLKPEDLTKLFKAFEQVGDAASKAEGTGLGLAITRRLVNVMGSDVHVESDYGKGSTFWFEVTLPVSQVEAPLTGKRVNKRITGYQGERLRIVVADDKSTNRLVIVNLLEPLGFEVLTAEDGREALEKVRKYTPHLLLTDLVMPVMTGFETAEELRKDPQFEDFPIIALSASVFEQDKQKSIVAGCNAFVPKPVQAEQLLEAMGELLGVEWTYAEEMVVSLEESLKDLAEEGVAVTPPPAEDVRVLYNLALDGDIEAITRYAEHLLQGDAAYHAFARRLIHLARGYQDQALVLFVKQYHVS